MSKIGLTWQQRRAIDRAQVLKKCMEAEVDWNKQPGRNLVLFFDGTGNILGNSSDTNVVRLMRSLNKRRPYEKALEQLAYYDPGVGTTNEFPPAGLGAKYRGFWQQLKGLALGHGAFDNVSEGYEFLCREYRPGDRIWLFGFSRGAFTARAVGGMVNMYGLVYPSGLPMVRTLVRTYFAESNEGRDNFARDVIKHFSLDRTPLLHFTGVWDTVETIGLTGGVTITNSTEFEHKLFVHIRHALAIHETREKYKPREYTAPAFTEEEQAYRSFKQCWFRGVHSDIGGSYAQDGLSNITLNWMMEEARRCGLEFSASPPAPERAHERMHDQVLDSPYWVLTGLNSRNRSKENAPIHLSALPVEDATPAKRSTSSWLARNLGFILFLVAGALLAMTLKAGKEACDLGGGSPWIASLPFAFQVLAPFTGTLQMSCTNDGVRVAVLWDFAFLAAYWLWLPYPVAWALRRCGARAIVAGKELSVVLSYVWLGLWAVLAVELFENTLALFLPGQPSLAWGVTFFFIVKLAILLWIMVVIIAGALNRRELGGRPL